MVQYNIAILGGPLVTHVNVVFSGGTLQWEVTRYKCYYKLGTGGPTLRRGVLPQRFKKCPRDPFLVWEVPPKNVC
jgi:hypothetical protein